MKNDRPPRLALAALSVQLLLTACSATAHSPQPPSAWPEPKPVAWPVQNVRSAPNFHAPSATHCARPVSTREVPGVPPGQYGGRYDGRDRLAKSGVAESARGDAPAPATAAAPWRSEAAPPAGVKGMADAAPDARHSAPIFPAPQGQPPVASSMPQQQAVPAQVVTAGVVDDNADFNGFLAFRNRTRVEHRPRDIRERYLLEVKDPRGRGIADAEVAVQADSGWSTWARTDAGGRVWLHPNAFDPAYSQGYQVAVRKDGRQSFGRLHRGQKSAVEVTLDARAAEPRARLDLVFLIDATGSMADEIDKLKSTLRTIVGEVSALPSRPDICLGLVAYRDRGDAFLLRSHDFTNDVGAFLQDALNPLRANGGGDYPEAMNEALHETVHRLSWRGDGATRLVVLLADAPPHLDYGAAHYDDDMMAALGKGIKVFSVGASGLDKQGEYIQRQIAQYTGGRFVFLTYAQARHPGSGPGRETVHDVKNYSVDTLDRLVVRLVSEELGKLAAGG
jgi:Mg-chelatase subunit ChlD